MKKDEKKKDQAKDPATEEQKTTGNQTEDPSKDEEENRKNVSSDSCGLLVSTPVLVPTA